MYESFNRGLWQKCFSLLDPRLREASKVEPSTYVKGLQEFKRVYGTIYPWYVRMSLHPRAPSSGQDRRPFAYVYVVWQDDARAFHMFRERWVKQRGRWFSRVAGLVPNRSAGGQD